MYLCYDALCPILLLFLANFAAYFASKILQLLFLSFRCLLFNVYFVSFIAYRMLFFLSFEILIRAYYFNFIQINRQEKTCLRRRIVVRVGETDEKVTFNDHYDISGITDPMIIGWYTQLLFFFEGWIIRNSRTPARGAFFRTLHRKGSANKDPLSCDFIHPRDRANGTWRLYYERDW